MLIDPKTGRKILPNLDRGALHYHLMLDEGTGLHYAANLQPDNFGEHEHKAYQITVPFGETVALSTWHSDGGRQRQAQVKAGQCYVIPSEQPHGLTIDQAGELINFYITPDFISLVLPEAAQPRSLDLGNLQISEDLFIRQLAETVRMDRLLHGVANKLLVESATNVLAFHLVNRYATTTVKLINPGKLSTRCLEKVKDFIAAESARDITIADIAQIAGYSVVHFTRMFKRTTGQTPHQYLLSYRIDHAKRLLQTTTLPISDIAYAVGFGSHAHFSTQFRQLTSTTPQVYRTYKQSN